LTPPTADRVYWEVRARRYGARAAGYSDFGAVAQIPGITLAGDVRLLIFEKGVP
jgi:hypothetical protein